GCSMLSMIEKNSDPIRHLRVRDKTMCYASLTTGSSIDKTETALLEGSFAETIHKLDACHELMAVVSHDLRTPLNTLILAASSIANRLAAEPAYSREVAMIRRAAEQMLHLVSDLLDVSLLQVGRLRIVPRPCAVEDLMRRITELLEPQARERNVELLI